MLADGRVLVCNDYRNILNRPNAELRDFVARPAETTEKSASGSKSTSHTKQKGALVSADGSPQPAYPAAQDQTKVAEKPVPVQAPGSKEGSASPQQYKGADVSPDLGLDKMALSEAKPARTAAHSLAGSRPIYGLAIYSASKPIKRGEEICISYGKGFWAAREG